MPDLHRGWGGRIAPVDAPETAADGYLAFAALAALVLTGQAGIRQDLRALRIDMLAGQADLRNDIRAGQAELRKDMRAGQAELRKDLRAVEAELRAGQARQEHDRCRRRPRERLGTRAGTAPWIRVPCRG